MAKKAKNTHQSTNMITEAHNQLSLGFFNAATLSTEVTSAVLSSLNQGKLQQLSSQIACFGVL